jgi:hypothetical protein
MSWTENSSGTGIRFNIDRKFINKNGITNNFVFLQGSQKCQKNGRPHKNGLPLLVLTSKSLYIIYLFLLAAF